MAAKSKKSTSKKEFNPANSLLLESAWEVCNPVGGIGTVVRSKIPAIKNIVDDRYCLIGPAVNPGRHAEVDPIIDGRDIIADVVAHMNEQGYNVFYGHWLVSGRPRVVLFDLAKELNNIAANNAQLSNDFDIPIKGDDDLIDQVIAYGKTTEVFLELLAERKKRLNIIVHFHEWMAGLPIMNIRKKDLPIKTVFTTHATMLGRYLAMNDNNFYENLPEYDWKKESKNFGIETIVRIERGCAHYADIFTTVSNVTGMECKYLLGKDPDHILPNGLNIQRFTSYHRMQMLHRQKKDIINQFVMSHFFSSYSFDLDKTLYFFTSGRYEYHNKGYNLTLEAMSKLNKLMKKANVDMTVVMFLITKKDSWSINPKVLESRAIMEELRLNTQAIEKQVGERLFMAGASSEKDFRLPDLNQMVDDYWRLRYRRTIQAWKSPDWPFIVTHNLHDPDNDDVLINLRKNKLINSPDDKVKIVYHPDFITSTNPLFGIDYPDFVRGCNLGIFPSYYEPWGYTPMECIASGVAAVTSDLSGFGDYVERNMDIGFDNGIMVLKREGKDIDASAENLAKYLFEFVKSTTRERINQRNKSEDLSEQFDWSVLGKEYITAYSMAINKRRSKKITKL
ncbi:MAG: glycosyltransferase [Bacteroidota bacterium]